MYLNPGLIYSNWCYSAWFLYGQTMKEQARSFSTEIKQIDLDVNRTFRNNIMFMERFGVKYVILIVITLKPLTRAVTKHAIGIFWTGLYTSVNFLRKCPGFSEIPLGRLPEPWGNKQGKPFNQNFGKTWEIPWNFALLIMHIMFMGCFGVKWDSCCCYTIRHIRPGQLLSMEGHIRI